MMVIQERPVQIREVSATPYQLVEPDEYCELAISLRSMTRCDDPVRGLRMLMDLETGQRFAVEYSKLMKYLDNRNN